MKTELSSQSTMKLYPFEQPFDNIPGNVLLTALFNAQSTACVSIRGMENNGSKHALFWVVFNFEFQQHIERWERKHADIEERPNKA